TGGPDYPPTACDPVAQTGCAAHQKCTWIKVDAGSGKVGCVADGTVAKAGACQYGPEGETTGFDDCAAPNVCVSGLCQEICTDEPDSCPSTETCQRWIDLFEGLAPAVGACAFLCDPVTQERALDSAPACGSPDPGTPSLGCYGVFNTEFTCASVPSSAAALTHGMEAFGPASGGAYINGCAPGYAPLIHSANDSSAPVICVAFCRPQETHSGDTAGADGVPGSGYACADRGATAAGMECHFLWYLEATPTATRNGIGFCWQPGNYAGDWDNDPNTADEPHPACIDLANTDTDATGAADHYEWGCAPYSG
ncbi:MAG: hypothetical protein HYZ27_06165, partial [Deltaproteobacteria bacterium]|nr:hypothetical protein [Deltaproteobacteria bacterium]